MKFLRYLPLLALVVGMQEAHAAGVLLNDGDELAPTGKGWGQRVPDFDRALRTPTKNSSTNGITYHGGPLLLGTPNIYYIWYGNWASNTAPTILTNLAQHIGGTPYFGIQTTYYNASNVHMSGAAAYVQSTTDNYSQGKTLTDEGVQAVVAKAITGGLPSDTNGVYFVLTSSDVNESSGFCTQYCGWHTDGTIGGKDIKYAFVGNPDRCPSACEMQTKVSPNGNTGADGMASIIAHELDEASNDPDLNAWYDSRGNESADKCAWTFGTTHALPNGSNYNVTLGSSNYLIQRNWVNASGGYCSMSYP